VWSWIRVIMMNIVRERKEAFEWEEPMCGEGGELIRPAKRSGWNGKRMR
jgi:hypothetical protein